MRYMVSLMESNVKAPLYLILARVAGVWALANVGYYLLFGLAGVGLSYNEAPVFIAAYFAFWAGITVLYFRDVYMRWLLLESRIWVSVLASLSFAALLTGLLYLLSQLPVLQGPALVPYSDLLFASLLDFLPKAAEILVQQLFITVVVLDLAHRYHALRSVIVGYMACFGGSHVLLYLLVTATPQYAAVMIGMSVLSAFVFPYLILRVRSGFLYTYMLHTLFYVAFALATHAWPPPGYIGG